MLDGFIEPAPADDIEVAVMDVLGEGSGVSLNSTCLSVFVRPSKADCGLLKNMPPRVEVASDEAIDDGRMLPPMGQSPLGRIEPNSSMSILGCLNIVLLRPRDVLFENTVFIRSMMTEFPEFDLPPSFGRPAKRGGPCREVDICGVAAGECFSESMT
jgi:hypothetical protein